jgi:hypothetical protein
MENVSDLLPRRSLRGISFEPLGPAFAKENPRRSMDNLEAGLARRMDHVGAMKAGIFESRLKSGEGNGGSHRADLDIGQE